MLSSEKEETPQTSQITQQQQTIINNTENEEDLEEEQVDNNSSTTTITNNKSIFKSYSKMENHYQQLIVNKFLNKDQQKDYNNNNNNNNKPIMIEWVCTEKVHGSNYSFIVTNENEIYVANRTKILDNFSNFFRQAQEEVNPRYKEAARKCFEMIKERKNEIVKSEKLLLTSTTTICDENDVMNGVDKGVKQNKEVGDYNNEVELIVKKIHIFGELFGGYFPEKKLTKEEEQKEKQEKKVFERFEERKVHIQKGVYYCPHYDFYAFDISVTFERKDLKTGEIETFDKWLTFDEADDILEKSGFKVRAKALFRGSLQDCLNFNVYFNTTIPTTFYNDICKEYNIEFQPETNICEGVVIKPANQHVWVGMRAIIKKKNPNFTEVNPPKDKSKRMKKKEMDGTVLLFDGFLTKEGLASWEELKRYLNKNRLANVESKIGKVDRKNFSVIMREFVNDALQDYHLDLENKEMIKVVNEEEDAKPQALIHLVEEDQKKVKKKCAEKAKEIVQSYMKSSDDFKKL
ncbi:hypothetical protein ABK040_002520 [Willaertia magna]